MYAISGASGDGKDEKSLAYQRGFFLGHPDFPIIIDALDRHAARTARQRKSTTNPVRDAAVVCMKRVVDQELSALKPVMRMDACDLSEESFLAIDIDEIMTETKAKAPRMWDFMTHSAETNMQRKRNRLKTPDYVSLPHHISHISAYNSSQARDILPLCHHVPSIPHIWPSDQITNFFSLFVPTCGQGLRHAQ
jgi:hypothetical protein